MKAINERSLANFSCLVLLFQYRVRVTYPGFFNGRGFKKSLHNGIMCAGENKMFYEEGSLYLKHDRSGCRGGTLNCLMTLKEVDGR